MSVNKLVYPGFGVGTFYGTPTTLGVAPTSTLTLTGTVLPAGAWHITGMAAGLTLNYVSTTNGFTATIAILSGVNGHIIYDGASGTIASTTTSVSVVAIGT